MFSNHITDKRYISTVYEELLSPYDPEVPLSYIDPREVLCIDPKTMSKDFMSYHLYYYDINGNLGPHYTGNR